VMSMQVATILAPAADTKTATPSWRVFRPRLARLSLSVPRKHLLRRNDTIQVVRQGQKLAQA
jgi:hypothetical protein